MAGGLGDFGMGDFGGLFFMEIRFVSRLGLGICVDLVGVLGTRLNGWSEGLGERNSV